MNDKHNFAVSNGWLFGDSFPNLEIIHKKVWQNYRFRQAVTYAGRNCRPAYFAIAEALYLNNQFIMVSHKAKQKFSNNQLV